MALLLCHRLEIISPTVRYYQVRGSPSAHFFIHLSLFQVTSSIVASRVGVLSTRRHEMTSSEAYWTGPLLFSHDWHVDTPIDSAEFGSLGLLC
jgi:hypothetical protein